MDRSVVLVTGANRGIGQASATLLAERGYTVFGTARKPSGESKHRFELLPLDVTSQESVNSCVSAVLERAGRIDVLVNNAGVGLIGAEEEASIEEARALFDANLFVLVRTPEGEEVARRGDAVCFPAGPDGAHKVTNTARPEARVVMFSSSRRPAVAVYPDSDKIGAFPGRDEDRVMLRREDGKRATGTARSEPQRTAIGRRGIKPEVARPG